MGKIELADGVHDRLRLVAAAWGVDEVTAIDRLLKRLVGPTPSEGSGDAPDSSDLERVYLDYRGTRVYGDFDRTSQAVTVTSGDCEGQTFSKPSPAARAVIRSLAPELKTTERNGWDEWRLDGNGAHLQTIRWG